MRSSGENGGRNSSDCRRPRGVLRGAEGSGQARQNVEIKTVLNERLRGVAEDKSFEPLRDVVRHRVVPPGRAQGAKFYAGVMSNTNGRSHLNRHDRGLQFPLWLRVLGR